MYSVPGFYSFAVIVVCASSSRDSHISRTDRESSSYSPNIQPAILLPIASPLDYHDVLQLDPLDEPYGYMINADDMPTLVKKAVMSAEKDKKYPLYDSETIGPSASKWLTRVEACIRKDHDMIQAIQQYYLAKANKAKSHAARARAIAKAEMWIASLELEEDKIESMATDIDTVGERYAQMAIKYWQEYAKAQRENKREDVLQAIDEKYQEAIAMKEFWENGTDLYTARCYAQKELRNANEAWVRYVREAQHPDIALQWGELPVGEEAWDALAKALAWNIRVRELLAEKRARKLADKLEKKAKITRRG